MHVDHMHSDPAYRTALRAAKLDSVDAVLRRVTGDIAAWSRTTDTLRVPCPGFHTAFYVKRYLYPRWSNRMRGALRGTFFGPPRGQSEYALLNELRDLGVPAVRPVAHGCRRVLHFVTACFLITEEVPQAVNLTAFGQSVLDEQRRVALRHQRRMSERLGEQVRELHEARFQHGQLFWRNLLYRALPDGEPEFYLLDVRPRRGRRRFAGGDRWWIDELAQLAASAAPFASRTLRLRCAMRYFGAERLSPEIKSYLREIERRRAHWERHEAQRIKMSALFAMWSRQLEREQPPPALCSGLACEPGAETQC